MKRILLAALLLICFAGASAQSENPRFDQSLATKLGAEEYGMKKYVLVMLRTGTAAISDKRIIDSLFKGHFNNMPRLTDEKMLIVAGPVGKNDKNYRGLFILNVQSIEEARVLVDSDPAVKSKLLDADFFSWYGFAHCPNIYLIRKKLKRRRCSDFFSILLKLLFFE